MHESLIIYTYESDVFLHIYSKNGKDFVSLSLGAVLMRVLPSNNTNKYCTLCEESQFADKVKNGYA